MPPRSSSTSSSSRRRSWKPLLAAAATYALLVGTWQAAVAPELPPRIFQSEERTGPMEWMPPHGLFLTQGDVRGAEILFLGDSRMRDDVVLDVLEEEGIRGGAVLWAASARLTALLPAARELGAPRLVVGLSVLSLEPPRGNAAGRVERGEPPPSGGDDFEERLAEWSEERIEDLVANGTPPGRARLVIEGMADIHRESVRRHGWSTSAIDERLDTWLDARRMDLVRAVPTSTWRDSWSYDIDPHQSDEVYAHRVDSYDAEAWAAMQELVVEELRNLREVEERAIPAERFAAICEAAGVPFLDYSREAYTTRDGSHLVEPEAKRLSRRLASDLRHLGL